MTISNPAAPLKQLPSPGVTVLAQGLLCPPYPVAFWLCSGSARSHPDMGAEVKWPKCHLVAGRRFPQMC